MTPTRWAVNIAGPSQMTAHRQRTTDMQNAPASRRGRCRSNIIERQVNFPIEDVQGWTCRSAGCIVLYMSYYQGALIMSKSIVTTKGRLDHADHKTVDWVGVRWLDTDYTECQPVVDSHGEWTDTDWVEVITTPTGQLCDAHREQLATGEWDGAELRAACALHVGDETPVGDPGGLRAWLGDDWTGEQVARIAELWQRLDGDLLDWDTDGEALLTAIAQHVDGTLDADQVAESDQTAQVRAEQTRAALRQTVRVLIADGMPEAEAARRLGLSRSTVRTWTGKPSW